MTEGTRIRLYTAYKKANGSRKEFIRLLEELGYKEGYNGYHIDGCGNVLVYVTAPDTYDGFGFKNE